MVFPFLLPAVALLAAITSGSADAGAPTGPPPAPGIVPPEMAERWAAAPANPADDGIPGEFPAIHERPLQVVLDTAMGRVVVNRAHGVRFVVARGEPRHVRFTMVNTTRRQQSVRVGILHLPDGDYDVYAAGPLGSGSKLDSRHLAAGWRFVAPAPQTEAPLGKYVRWLTDRMNRTRLLLSNRAEPELTKALTPLEAALARTRSDLEATKRTDVTIVNSETRFIQPPVRSPLLSEAEMEQRRGELERLRRNVIAATDRAGDRAVGSRVRYSFTIRGPLPGYGSQ